MLAFDVAIAGLGAMGAFACMEAARRGASVIGFDRFAPPHANGSHSGETRVFRTAYAEHPDYVPLAVRAGDLWDQLGERTGRTLLHRCGMLSIGPPESELIRGIRHSATRHGVPLTALDAPAIRREYPAFSPPSNHVGVMEGAAGWIDVNAAILTALELARGFGAQIVLNSPVTKWEAGGGEVRITTLTGTYSARHLVIAAGAWAPELLRELGLPLRVQRKVMAWLQPANAEPYAPGRCPVFAFADRFFYGFPNLADAGVKLAIHWDDGESLPGADAPVQAPGESDIAPILEMAGRYLPALADLKDDLRARVRCAKTCLYTMTPDQHFILDCFPRTENVYFAAGFSGHGFKFAPVIGEALADLALDGRTELPVGFLGLRGRLFSEF